MELLKSKRGITLPQIVYITDRKDILKLPLGTPFIYGDEKSKDVIIRLIEYEVLYRRALATGLPFDFKLLLQEAGFDVKEMDYIVTVFVDHVDEEDYENAENDDYEDDFEKHDIRDTFLFHECINDCTALVDMEKLKGLKIIPVFNSDIEKAVKQNIHNYIQYNQYMYNKRLDGMYGDMEMTPIKRALIIVDISSSIPKGVGIATLAMAKNNAEAFYADILVTGSKSILYPYEEIHLMNIDEVYNKIGMSNEQKDFKRLLTSSVREYSTAIVYGDGNHPGSAWRGNDKEISDKTGKEICKWKVDKVISLHTTSNYELAGYARWFSPKETEHITDWVKYLKKETEK